MLKNLTIKRKLILALLIPIVGLIYFVVQITIIDVNQQNKIDQLEIFLHNSVELSSVVHELQKERGLSGGFIGKRGKKFKVQLIYQRKITDLRIEKFLKNIDQYKSYSYFKLDKVVKYLNNLKNIRNKVDKQQITFDDILKYYTTLNRYLIEFMSRFSLINHNSEISKMVIAYVNLLKAKENSAIERGILSSVFSTGEMDAKRYREFSILFASHETYIKSYKLLINQKQLKHFNTLMKDESIAEVDELRELAFSKLVKDKIISDIKAAAGYGGLIHNFKNFILRGDLKYYYDVIKNYTSINLAINKFKTLPTATNEELELIETIRTTFDKYRLVLQLALTMQEQSNSIRNLDKMVSIDSKPAVDAMNILSNNILGANATYWYNISTKRINILKTIENDFVSDMLKAMNHIKSKIIEKFLVNSIVFSCIFIVLLILSLRLIYRTSFALSEVQNGLINFFDYLRGDKKEIKTINIINNDELGQMGLMINNNIKKTKKYLDIKVSEQLMESQRKDKILFQQSKMVAMGEMIGNIAHQWRQPLSIISTGATGMLLQKEYGVLSDEHFHKTCNNINLNAQYLSKTIDDFKNFIKGNRQKTLFSLKQEMDTFLQLVSSSIKTYHIDVILDIDNDIEVDGYRNELTQCLINVFNNAKDALQDMKEENRFVFISTTIENNNVMIKIRDSAGGIPDDILPKIFEPYFTTKHKAQGTGLGLHMTYNLIVDGMKGMIDVTNVHYRYKEKDYKGAEFHIMLPFK